MGRGYVRLRRHSLIIGYRLRPLGMHSSFHPAKRLDAIPKTKEIIEVFPVFSLFNKETADIFLHLYE